jgi:hypothetical protein
MFSLSIHRRGGGNQLRWPNCHPDQCRSQLKGISLQTAAAALAVFQQAIAEGYGDEDFSAVSKSSKRLPH